MTVKNLKPQAAYFYWAFTLRLLDAPAIELWATESIASIDSPPAPLLELATLGFRDTESVLEQLRLVPGEEDSGATFLMLMGLLAHRYFTGIDSLSHTLRLCDALRFEFSSPSELVDKMTRLCKRWEGVEHGFGEVEQVFCSAFEEFLRQFHKRD